MNARPLVATLLLIALAFAGCAGAPKAAPMTDEPGSPADVTDDPGPAREAEHVHVHGDEFIPGAMTVTDGTPLTFHSHVDGHMIAIHKEGNAADQYELDQALDAGAEASYTFTGPGVTYHVFCKEHSSVGQAMRVTVS